jgi:hypothetical protein
MRSPYKSARMKPALETLVMRRPAPPPAPDVFRATRYTGRKDLPGMCRCTCLSEWFNFEKPTSRPHVHAETPQSHHTRAVRRGDWVIWHPSNDAYGNPGWYDVLSSEEFDRDWFVVRSWPGSR